MYRKDGTLTLMERSERTKGSGRSRNEKVCLKYPDEDKERHLVSRTRRRGHAPPTPMATVRASSSCRAIRRTLDATHVLRTGSAVRSLLLVSGADALAVRKKRMKESTG